MIQTGILNPHILSLVARVRHTNMLVIADRGFPYWPAIETVDISLVDDVPTVLQVFEAIRPNFGIAEILMAREFLEVNDQETRDPYARALAGIPTTYEAHASLKQWVPQAVGLIRTGDTTRYANMILVSG
jgi:D-ribose pyranase